MHRGCAPLTSVRWAQPRLRVAATARAVRAMSCPSPACVWHTFCSQRRPSRSRRTLGAAGNKAAVGAFASWTARPCVSYALLAPGASAAPCLSCSAPSVSACRAPCYLEAACPPAQPKLRGPASGVSLQRQCVRCRVGSGGLKQGPCGRHSQVKEAGPRLEATDSQMHPAGGAHHAHHAEGWRGLLLCQIF